MTTNKTLEILSNNTIFSNSCLLYCGHKEKENLPPFEKKFILGQSIVDIVRNAFGGADNDR